MMMCCTSSLRVTKTYFLGGIVLDNVTYPIGRFVFEGMTALQRQEWTKEIEQYPSALKAMIKDFTEEQLDTPCRAGGWTVRQTVHHLADFSSHAFSRFKLALTEVNPTIKPFLENEWVLLADNVTTPITPSLNIIDGVYARLTVLLESMSVAQFERQFYHPERGSQFSLKAFLSFTRWHSYHHLAIIEQLKDKKNW